MSRTNHSKGCPNGRDCGVCSPGKGIERVRPRDRRRLQDQAEGDLSTESGLEVPLEDEPTSEERANWDEYRYPDDAGMDLWDETLSDDRID